MTDYGVQPTGYVRKPLAVHLAELEAKMVSEFGPGVIQTEQSPLGQLNGMMADLLDELDERNLDLYQSYDPDQAEERRLDILGRLRLLYRGTQTEPQFRQAITNAGEARIDIQDLQGALRSLSGVTFAKYWEEGEGLGRGTVAVAIIGGDDDDIADTMRRYIVPGISTYGNYRVSSTSSGACRSLSIIRPIDVPVKIILNARAGPGLGGCPPPSIASLKAAVVSGWAATRVNGLDVDHFTLRGIVERQFPNIELVSFTGERDGQAGGNNQAVSIGFIEIASIAANDVEVNLV